METPVPKISIYAIFWVNTVLEITFLCLVTFDLFSGVHLRYCQATSTCQMLYF